MGAGSEWGPLAGLAGVWESENGLDVAYSNERGEIGETPYREHAELKPFGPVENGKQVLYGLDYRMAGYRHGEEIPFHTEVGYWLWDAATRQAMRCFMIPRGTLVLAGGTVEAAATSFTLTAEAGSATYGILSNQFLQTSARTVRNEVNVRLEDDDTFSYDEVSSIEHGRIEELLQHTDRNTLKRVAEA